MLKGGSHITEWIQESLLSFVDRYRYIGMFCSMVFGILGLPVPDEILMTSVGYFIIQRKNALYPDRTGFRVGKFAGHVPVI